MHEFSSKINEIKQLNWYLRDLNQKLSMKKLVFFIGLSLISCHSIKEKSSEKNSENTVVGSTENQEVKETASVYRASETVLTDLIHTKLEVSFDWSKSWMFGKETLTAKPHFYATNQLILDAKGMEIKAVSLNGAPLIFQYANDVLTITLDKTYKRSEQYTVVIDYIAKPDERLTSGSSAISSDKGLYFINPKGLENNKMPQIWTQGETEASSVWFPTIDAPNSKTTQEIFITVDNKYVTLSNGKLISSKENGNGTRVDHWKQELPHAPYLFMMGVGEFKVVKDYYTRQNGTQMEVNYYVEPEWESSAKAIFGETPAMIDYFSKLLGVEYPWDKYSQIVVRDYVSGAMENTGAVVFGDYAYKTARELLDGNDQSTIAHELFHHWFGDLVTCESWSNLSLNESFANYSQYLWDEFKFGKDEADFRALEEADGYYASADQSGYHNLIWFDYNSQEDMFDGHSYNKGGRILHMLRSYLGDEAFFLSLQNYLKTNAYHPAEFNELRLAFEAVSGEDLNWFFNQWYLDKGHPTLEIDYAYETAAKNVRLTIKQVQGDEFRTFKMPVNVTVFDDRGATTQRVWIDEKTENIDLAVVGALKNVIFDEQAMLLARIVETKPQDWYIHQYYNGKKYTHRKNAFQFGLTTQTTATDQLILDGLKDPFWDIRATAMSNYSRLSSDAKLRALAIIKSAVQRDVNPQVRAAALTVISTNATVEEAEGYLEDRIKNDQSYAVMSKALEELAKVNAPNALLFAKKLENEPSSKMLGSICGLYGKVGTLDNMPFFEKVLKNNIVQGSDKLEALFGFVVILTKQDALIQRKYLPILEEQGKNGGMYAQLFYPQFIGYLSDALANSIVDLKDKEAQARKSGNTNSEAIIKGKRTEAEALQHDYEIILKAFDKKD